MDDEEFEIRPERATFGRFLLAGLAFVSELSQAVTNFVGSVTMVVAADQMQKNYDSEFRRITGDFSNTTGLGTGSTEQED